MEYSPYGEQWIDEGSDRSIIGYRFTSKELDTETGLYYFGARYMDPTTSRWMSADPELGKYLPSVGSNTDNLPGQGGVFNLFNLAVYHYANNNPIKYVDPNGKLPVDYVEAQHPGYAAVGPWGTVVWAPSPTKEDWERGERVTNVVLEAIPATSVAKAGIELATGKTLLGGEKLKPSEVALDTATIATAGVAKYASSGAKALGKALGEAPKASETFEHAVESVSLGATVARAAVAEVKNATGAIKSTVESMNTAATSWWNANMKAPPSPPAPQPAFRNDE